MPLSVMLTSTMIACDGIVVSAPATATDGTARAATLAISTARILTVPLVRRAIDIRCDVLDLLHGELCREGRHHPGAVGDELDHDLLAGLRVVEVRAHPARGSG